MRYPEMAGRAWGRAAALLLLGIAAARAADGLGEMADRPGAEWVEWAGSADGGTAAFLNAATLAGLGGGHVRFDALFNMAAAEPVGARRAETYSSYVVTYEAACDAGALRPLWTRLHARRGAAGEPLHAFRPPGESWSTPPPGSIAEELLRGACETIGREEAPKG